MVLLAMTYGNTYSNVIEFDFYLYYVGWSYHGSQFCVCSDWIGQLGMTAA